MEWRARPGPPADVWFKAPKRRSEWPFDLSTRLTAAARDAEHLAAKIDTSQHMAQMLWDRASAYGRALRDVVLADRRGSGLRPAIDRAAELIEAEQRYGVPRRDAIWHYLSGLHPTQEDTDTGVTETTGLATRPSSRMVFPMTSEELERSLVELAAEAAGVPTKDDERSAEDHLALIPILLEIADLATRHLGEHARTAVALGFRWDKIGEAAGGITGSGASKRYGRAATRPTRPGSKTASDRGATVAR